MKVYTLPSCQQCTATKKFLNNLGKDYEVIDLSEQPAEVIADFKSRGLMAAPIVVTDTDAWSGFRPDKLTHM